MNKNTKEVIEKIYSGNGRLYLWCILVGLITGLTVSLYRTALDIIGGLRQKFFTEASLENPFELLKIWLIFVVVGLVINFLYQKYPKTSGSGIPQVKGLILGKIDYPQWFPEFLTKFITGIIGIGAGLSLGREGPSVQLGSYIGYGISKISKKDVVDRNYLITSGASAGLSGAFGAPLAGAMFSIEEIHRYISGKLLICIFLASICANFVSQLFFGQQTSFNINIRYILMMSPYLQFGLYILFGIIIAMFGKLFTYTLVKSMNIFNEIKSSRMIKVSFVMSLSFVLCFVFPEVTGGGHHLAEGLTHSKLTILTLVVIFIIKLLFTTISYSTGFSGGIFLPMLVLGALIGKIFGEVVNQINFIGSDFVIHYIVLGMAAYFVAVVRAPITGVILILEMTGSFDLLFGMVTVSVVAFYITELLGQEPIYEILYKSMKKDEDIPEDYHVRKTIIKIPVMSESLLDRKKISEIYWPEDILVIALERSGVEKIPKGRTIMLGGDVLYLLLPENKIFEVKEHLLKKGAFD